MRNVKYDFMVFDWDNDVILLSRQIGLVIYSWVSNYTWKPSDIWAD